MLILFQYGDEEIHVNIPRHKIIKNVNIICFQFLRVDLNLFVAIILCVKNERIFMKQSGDEEIKVRTKILYVLSQIFNG
jgi:hypothetical protein